MQGLIDIEPKQYLDFQPEENKLASTQLNVINLSNQEITYKIKTTTPNLFQVKPSIGVLQAGNTQIVEISTTHPVRQDTKLDSKFQINASLFDQSVDIPVFWKTRDNTQIQSVQVKSRVQAHAGAEQLQTQQIQQNIEQQPLEKSIANSTYSDSKMFQSVVDTNKEKDDEIQKYKEQLEKLQKEFADYKLSLNSVKQQEAVVKYHTNKFEMKHVLIIVIIAILAGYLCGQ